MTLRTTSLLLGSSLAAAILVVVMSRSDSSFDSAPAGALFAPRPVSAAAGPLRVNPANPRYFIDPAGRTVYLAGAHTWNSLQDIGPDYPPAPFDFTRYLDFLQEHHLNFIRLWRWDTCGWTDPIAKHRLYAAPQPWLRTGPGVAGDGRPKFDLTRFDETFFTRLRDRIAEAAARGIYVSVMLFEGWTVRFTDDAWRGHPFHPGNNISLIDPRLNGDRAGVRLHTLQIPAVTRLQEDYVRHLVAAVADLDNVLFEIANEAHSGSHAWQAHMLRFVRECEAGAPKQHPIGLTSTGGSGVDDTTLLFTSAADWVSPNAQRDDYMRNPPAASGAKVVIVDTDHLWGLGGDEAWVWKSFLRGLNPILMDPYRNAIVPSPMPPERLEAMRRALGQTQDFAARLDLAAASPRPDLATSGYCLAVPGSDYLVYLPVESNHRVTVDLHDAAGLLAVEWFDPAHGRRQAADPIKGGSSQTFDSPFDGPGLLRIHSARTDADATTASAL